MRGLGIADPPSGPGANRRWGKASEDAGLDAVGQLRTAHMMRNCRLWLCDVASTDVRARHFDEVSQEGYDPQPLPILPAKMAQVQSDTISVRAKF